jgi:elongation factor 1-gamma
MVPLYASSAFHNIVAGPLMYTFYGCFFMKAEEASIFALKRALGALNLHLTSNTYLVGHSVTLADIIMTCNLHTGFSYVMTKSFTSEFPHVERYFWTMVNQPNVKKVVGEVKQAESVLPVTKPSQPKEPAKSKPKDEPRKEVKEKEPAKPKAEPAAEEEEAPKPKPKNPLDLLPPSKMILDDWKRLYSNTKTNFREVAIKGTFALFFSPFPVLLL